MKAGGAKTPAAKVAGGFGVPDSFNAVLQSRAITAADADSAAVPRESAHGATEREHET